MFEWIKEAWDMFRNSLDALDDFVEGRSWEW